MHHVNTRPRRGRSSTPRRVRTLALTAVATAAIVALVSPGGGARADDATTRVILNGVPVPVAFNDGDTFRVMGGPSKGARARLVGFNTLESYGPVHQWGEWTHRELYVLAKMATLHARRGTWTCESDGKTDGYGRMLAWCPDLAMSQIRAGYAHAITITDEPAAPELLEAQRDAIANRRGMWAHGVPAFVLSSLHSIEENPERGVYNRLVSTEDGHSVQWWHKDTYAECQAVCQVVYPVDAAVVAAAAAAMKTDPQVAALIGGLSDDALAGVARDFARYRHVNRDVPEARRRDLETLLSAWAAAGKLGDGAGTPGSCMVHAPYQRRFGRGKAKCLKLD